tara:strand:- start:2486 stop:2809 length:324 start_codon:yes stop_codon:yes gene_type:complete
MNFNKTDTAASILKSLPNGMELRLKDSQSNLTAFVVGVSEEDQAEDKRRLMLKIEMAKTELRSLLNYGPKMAFYHDKPELLKADINTARGKLEFLEVCLKTSHGGGA